MPALCSALRCVGTSTSTRSSSASESEYPNISLATGFHRTTCWVSASATITAARAFSKSLPMPKSSGRMSFKRASCHHQSRHHLRGRLSGRSQDTVSLSSAPEAALAIDARRSRAAQGFAVARSADRPASVAENVRGAKRGYNCPGGPRRPRQGPRWNGPTPARSTSRPWKEREVLRELLVLTIILTIVVAAIYISFAS